MHAILLVALILSAPETSPPGPIQHRFLALDESRDQLLYVDQANPANDWTIKLPGKHRDLQLIGQQRVLLTHPDGYREFSLTSQTMVKEVKGYRGATSAQRLADGHTVLACNQQGVTVYDLGPDDQPVRKTVFEAGGTRLLRLTPQGTLLFGSSNQILEGDWQGKRLKPITLKSGIWVYQVLRTPSGHLLAAGGYDPTILELDADGNVLKTIGGRMTDEEKSLGYHFFGGFQVLPSGDVVVSNWTGHGAADSQKGVQIVQYSPAGRLVWKWHEPARAGSINGVIVLDGLDTSVLNDDVSSVLGPAAR